MEVSKIKKEKMTFEITKRYGVISVSEKGWSKELNLIAWNGNNPRLDIRDWSPDHKYMSKGVTLDYKQARTLKRLLEKIK